MYFNCGLKLRLPAWYELGIADEGRRLVVSLGPTAYAVIQEHLTGRYQWITRFKEQFRLPAFVPPTESAWGFGAVCVSQSARREGWKAWEIELPAVAPEQQWTAFRAITASLASLFMCLWLVEDRGDCSAPQLLECELLVGEGMGGSGIWAGTSPTLCRWLAQQPHESYHPGISAAMRCAFQQLSGKEPLGQSRIHALMRQPKWVNFNCVGNACGLDPDGYENRDLDKGYMLLPHNVDSPIQQLTLLVGLAALHHYARADGF